MLVSAIMPTRGRRELAAMTVQNFVSQTWSEKELIILDDADCLSFEKPPEFLNVRYMIADKRYNIAEKRNILCKAAAGEIIVHFDSDDWSAPTRIERQMEVMNAEKKAVCGLRKMYFWQEAKKQAWIYNGTSNYALGTSLMFQRSWWAHNRWDARFKIGSDNVFVSKASHAKQLANPTILELMVSRNHASNTNSRRYGVNWKKVDRAVLPVAFFECSPMGGVREEIKTNAI